MKNKGIENAPNDVMYIHVMSMNNIPIGYDLYKRTLEKYPEWFPEEMEHKRKMGLASEKEMEAYYKELFEETNKIRDKYRKKLKTDIETKDGMITMKGLEQALSNMDYNSNLSIKEEKEQEKTRKKIYDKYFSKY